MKKSFAALVALLLATDAFAQVPSGGGPGVPNGAALTSPTIPADPGLGASAPRLAQVTARVGIPNQVSGSNTQGGWRSWQVAYDDLYFIKVCYWNGRVGSASAEAGTGGPGTYRTAYEYPFKSGNYVDVPAGGVTTGLVLADAAIGCTDVFALPTPIPAFTKFRLSGDVSGTGSFRTPALGWSDACDRSGGDEFQSGASGYNHYKDTTVLGAGGAQCYHPALVLGYTRRGVPWVVGDSIAAGVNDQGHDPSGGRGLFGRALAALGPHLNYGVPGDTAALYAVGANSTNRTTLAAMGGATLLLLQLGRNDISNARTVDQILTDRASIVTAAKVAIPGIKTLYTTITPVTTSTNFWADTANQTIVSASQNNTRASFNDFLRGVVSYSTTCTETTSNATLASCTGLPVTSVAPGMRVTGTGITGTTTITAVDTVAGTITVDVAGNVTGSGAQALTIAWPSITTTFPTVNDGLIDIAGSLETGNGATGGTQLNGGLWTPYTVGRTDGTHPNAYGYGQVQSPTTNAVKAQRGIYNFLLKRDLDPASNDNTPMWQNEAA